MCAIFGLLDFKGKLTPDERRNIIRALGTAAEVRGTDASGIAYVRNGGIYVQKAPRPAHKMRWQIDADARYIMGHTRLTTQGCEKNIQLQITRTTVRPFVLSFLRPPPDSDL